MKKQIGHLTNHRVFDVDYIAGTTEMEITIKLITPRPNEALLIANEILEEINQTVMNYQPKTNDAEGSN